MPSKVIFGYPKWPPAAILKIKVAYWSKMVRNAIESDFWSSKMAGVGNFVNKFKNKKVAYDVFVYDLACLLCLILVVGAYIA